MGYMCHHAIIVTASYGDWIEKAHKQAKKMFGDISPILESQCNGVKSFFIPPDGSKEGWAESDAGDKSREGFIEWLNSLRYEDGSSPLDWVELQYGDDNKDNKVIATSDDELAKSKDGGSK